MKKRLISTLLTIAMLTSLLPTAFAANTVTRAEWISQLVAAFSMTVEDDSNMPDNYFSDITESDSYYRDILLAVEFGVIDLEAGEAFEPNENATREFAAQTLNSCLQFQLDEGAEYTFSEADSVTYPDDIQVAVNRNWFALSGGNFLPEQAITSAEATAMIKDAKAVIANDGIDENYNSTYKFADGVIVIPETVETELDSDNTVTITDYDAQISKDDIFVVYQNNYPIVLKAVNMQKSETATVISTTKDGTENAVLSVDSQGSIDIDLEDFHFDELTTYSITNTETGQNEEMAIQLYGISYDKGSKTLTASKKLSIGDATAGTVTVKMTNFKVDHKENTISGDYETTLTADTNITTSVEFDLGKYTGIPSSLVLGTASIGLVNITLSVDYSLKGGVTMSWDGVLTSGYVKDKNGFRIKAAFSKKSFDFTAKAELEVGLRLQASLELIAIKGNIYATVGVDMSAELKYFDSGAPSTCVTIKGYLFADVGASVTFRYLIGEKSYSKSIPIYNEYNSPVRAVYHYEDGQLVHSCSRGQSLKYTTSPHSRYFNPYGGQGSYGGGEGVAPVVIWEYEVEEGNATITKYNGSASAIAIPSTIDGYTVTKIGESAFGWNEVIRTVTMPSSIVEIGWSAFENCTSLQSVIISDNVLIIRGYAFKNCKSLQEIHLPQYLEELGSGAFEYCTSLNSINIPKSVQVDSFGSPFKGCESLKNVEFDDGIIAVPAHLFADCNGLEIIALPDTITSVGYGAFDNCINLKKVILSPYVVEIEYGAFSDCANLEDIILPEFLEKINGDAFRNCLSFKNIKIPNSVLVIEDSAFENCLNLENINLPNNLESLGSDVFKDCKLLNNIHIPKTITYCSFRPFNGCSGLKNVTFEKGITSIPTFLFQSCDGLEEITIPDTVAEIEWGAFEDCKNLKSISLSNNLKIISGLGGAFSGCSSLEEISLPDSLTDMCNGVFEGCTALKSVKLSDNLACIEYDTFKNCSSLKNITIPPNCEEISNSAFYGCTQLNSVKMQYGLKRIDEYAFYDCDALTDISIPDSVTSLGLEVFRGCDNLTNVTLGSGITQIPDSAFRQCQALQEIILPRYCTEVADSAFAEDTKLKTITALTSVINIENNAFSYPNKMTMRGVSGSYAQEYANNRHMTFEDINIPVTELNFYKDELDFSDVLYQTKVLPLRIMPSDSTADITYTSANEEVATVENGVVTSIGYGTTAITAQSGNCKDTITINVLRPAYSISLDQTELELEAGDIAKLEATLDPSDATDKIAWKSSNENVATINNGIVTAIGAGTAVITVTTTGGKTASCTVKVTGIFTVTATAGENGKISPSGEVLVKSNGKTTFNILPDYGYVVKDVLVSGTSVGAVESYTFSNLTANATITAEFAKVDVTYEDNTITISSEAALKNLKLIVATYEDNCRLTNCEIKTVTTNEGENYQETITETDNIKLMLWNGLDTMCPIWCSK